MMPLVHRQAQSFRSSACSGAVLCSSPTPLMLDNGATNSRLLSPDLMATLTRPSALLPVTISLWILVMLPSMPLWTALDTTLLCSPDSSPPVPSMPICVLLPAQPRVFTTWPILLLRVNPRLASSSLLTSFTRMALLLDKLARSTPWPGTQHITQIKATITAMITTQSATVTRSQT